MNNVIAHPRVIVDRAPTLVLRDAAFVTGYGFGRSASGAHHPATFHGSSDSQTLLNDRPQSVLGSSCGRKRPR